MKNYYNPMIYNHKHFNYYNLNSSQINTGKFQKEVITNYSYNHKTHFINWQSEPVSIEIKQELLLCMYCPQFKSNNLE